MKAGNSLIIKRVPAKKKFKKIADSYRNAYKKLKPLTCTLKHLHVSGYGSRQKLLAIATNIVLNNKCFM